MTASGARMGLCQPPAVTDPVQMLDLVDELSPEARRRLLRRMALNSIPLSGSETLELALQELSTSRAAYPIDWSRHRG